MPGFLPSIKWSRFPQSPFSPSRANSTPLATTEHDTAAFQQASPRLLPGHLLIQHSTSTVALSSTPANGHSSQQHPLEEDDTVSLEPLPLADTPHKPKSEDVAISAQADLNELKQVYAQPALIAAPTLSSKQQGSSSSTVKLLPSEEVVRGTSGATSDQIETNPAQLLEGSVSSEAGALTSPATCDAPETLATLKAEPPVSTENSKTEAAPEKAEDKSRPSKSQTGLESSESSQVYLRSPALATNLVEPPMSETTSLHIQDQERAAVIKAELLSPGPDSDKENTPQMPDAIQQPLALNDEKKKKKTPFEMVTSPLKSSFQNHQEGGGSGLSRGLSWKRKNQVPIGDRLKGVLEQVKGKVKKDKEAVSYGKALSQGELGV